MFESRGFSRPAAFPASLLATLLVLLSGAEPAFAQDNPSNHRILLGRSSDGLTWTLDPQALAERASVPELFLNPEGRPTVLFVDAGGERGGIGALQWNADGQWNRVPTNLPEVDPNVVRLSDGTYRAYVKTFSGSILAFGSSDGLSWYPLGEAFRDARYANATDPDVFETPDGWVMLISLGPRLLRCTSADGLRFTTDGTVIDLGGSVSDTIRVPSGWRTYFHVNPDPATGSRMRIRSAFTADGRTWQVEPGDRVAAPPTGPASFGVGDPAAVQLADGSWLMAIKSFIAPPGFGNTQPGNGGMTSHWVGSASSADGLTWTRDAGVRLSPGSVPAVINDRDERILMYFVQPPSQPGKPETVACAVSTDGVKFELAPDFQIEGLSTLKAVDPSIVKDEDGRFRLYYLASDHPGDPAAGPNPHAIHMALSDDGIRFREAGAVFRYPDLVDPDVFRFQNQWFMYVFSRDRTIIARSDSGMEFAYEASLSPAGWGTTAPVTLPDGRLRLYAFDQRTPVGNVVRSFLSDDGINWTAELGDRLQGQAREQLTDPFVISWRGAYKMFFKSNAPLSGFFTGQNAGLVLGAKGFNETGGASLFNHPTGLATDGTSLLMTDRWNNRVLVWKIAPQGNVPPDFVLGQPGFRSNNTGSARNQLNWPGNVAIAPDGTTIAVTDTNNNRILIWKQFPAASGVAADIVLDLTRLARPPSGGPGSMPIGWPWGVWTDGTRLAVVATQGAAVLIWNSIPTEDNQPPDWILRPRGAGTPRNITSDGATFFALSDHNNGPASQPATMVWLEFPSAPDQPYAYSLPEWMKGTITPDGRLIMAGIQSIYLWNRRPLSAGTPADVVLRPQSYRNGDGPDAVVASGRLYVSNYNGNNVLGWNRVPLNASEPPDFSIGSDRPEQDTWAENFFIQNPVLSTDGVALFASSDFDRKLFVWRSLPRESATPPDAVVSLREGPWDNALHAGKLAAAGRRTVYLWNRLPLNGEAPDVTFTDRIGDAVFRELTGIAMDNRHFYLADRQANRIYVWDGIPEPGSAPKATLDMQNPGRLSSDGNYLTAAPFEGSEILVWPVDDIGSGNRFLRLGGPGAFNLPSEALSAGGRFFVADRSNNRVLVWNDLQAALQGRPADAHLGARDSNDRSSGLSAGKLFMPASLAWDGAHLWVGEFKFSTRILRFSADR